MFAQVLVTGSVRSSVGGKFQNLLSKGWGSSFSSTVSLYAGCNADLLLGARAAVLDVVGGNTSC